MIEIKNDDDCVMMYLDISYRIQHFEHDQYIEIIKWAEKEYINEADSPLGDFINDMFLTYLHYLREDSIDSDIREVIYEHDLNYDMIYTVGEHILSHPFFL